MDTSTLKSRLETASASFKNLELQLADPDVASDPKRLETIARERARLEPLVLDYQQLQEIDIQSIEAKNFLRESKSDKEMEALAYEELQRLEKLEEFLVNRLTLALLPKDPRDERSVMLEIRAGAGGDEACIWAGDLARMYERYSLKVGWSVKPMSATEADLGGFRELIISVKGQAVFSQLKFEAGVHRVQRVPATESQGRVHTSACSVAVLPEMDEIDEISIDKSDLRVDTFRASGAGGQHVNKTDSAVRLTHIPTGIVVECQDGRSQHKNKEKALSLLQSKLLDAEREKKDTEQAENRKVMVGSGDRSEKIRTYNFPQNRITDHRIEMSVHNLPAFLDGDMEEMISSLLEENQARALANLESKN